MIELLTQQEFTEQLNPLSLFGQATIVTIIASIFGMLHRSAVNAYKEVADVHKKIADTERQRADTAQAQLVELLRPIRNTSHETAI